MDQVQEQQVAITITKRGKPIAKLVPVSETPKQRFGCLKDSVTIVGDIISPIDVSWDANQ